MFYSTSVLINRTHISGQNINANNVKSVLQKQYRQHICEFHKRNKKIVIIKRHNANDLVLAVNHNKISINSFVATRRPFVILIILFSPVVGISVFVTESFIMGPILAGIGSGIIGIGLHLYYTNKVRDFRNEVFSFLQGYINQKNS